MARHWRGAMLFAAKVFDAGAGAKVEPGRGVRRQRSHGDLRRWRVIGATLVLAAVRFLTEMPERNTTTAHLMDASVARKTFTEMV